jgi:phenylpropionate dioxygenase-like ring-hydroxylating dioxygenase large terminal subunit
VRTPPRSPADEAAFLDAARYFWHPVARSGDIAPGGVLGVRLLDEDLVLWRTDEGALGLTDDMCAHRGTMLSDGGSVTTDGCLRCPYHAWEYDAAGQCTRIPQLVNQAIAKKVRIAAYRVVDYAGLIWTCLVPEGQEKRGIPVVPRAQDPDWWLYAGTPPTWQCQAPRMVENFLDISHFGIVHSGNFGNPDIEIVEPYRPVTDLADHSITFTFPYLTRDRWSPPVDGRPATRLVDYEYRAELPFGCWIKGAGKDDIEYYTTIAVCPVSPQETKVFWVVTFPNTLVYTEDELNAGFLPFFEEDQRIVERQRPEWLPLDLGIELQMTFDRIAVSYRTALSDLGFPVLNFPRTRISEEQQ